MAAAAVRWIDRKHPHWRADPARHRTQSNRDVIQPRLHWLVSASAHVQVCVWCLSQQFRSLLWFRISDFGQVMSCFCCCFGDADFLFLWLFGWWSWSADRAFCSVASVVAVSVNLCLNVCVCAVEVSVISWFVIFGMFRFCFPYLRFYFCLFVFFLASVISLVFVTKIGCFCLFVSI